MSFDPYYLVKDILAHLNRFHGAESLLLQHPPGAFGYPYFYRVSAIEKDMANAPRYIDRIYREFQRMSAESPKPLFSIRLRRALTRSTDLTNPGCAGGAGSFSMLPTD